jgi:endogenous inhibitor of DNA gyrase (YacG/DUF329 family)
LEVHRKHCDESGVENNTSFECSCGRVFKSKGGYNMHRRGCEASNLESFSYGKVECPKCGKKVSKTQLENHKNSKSCKEDNVYDGINYNDPQITKKGNRIGEDEYECIECEKVFSKKGISTHFWLNHTKEGKSHKEKLGDQKRFCREDGEIWNKGKKLKSKEEVLCKDSEASSEYVREFILHYDLIEYKCDKCGNDGEWMNETLTLHLDHINGNRRDQRLSNLRFLCPNCHSQTETYCGKKNRFGELRDKKVSDKKLKKALKNGPAAPERALLSLTDDLKGRPAVPGPAGFLFVRGDGLALAVALVL